MNPALLRRTQLLPGKSLASVLERLTQLNYYPSARTLQQICRNCLEAPANQDELRLPQWVETFLQLADLTHIAPEELFAASDHRFAPFLTSPQQPPVEIPWTGLTSKAILTPNLARGSLHSPSAAQYCPHCLKSAAYHRLSWIPISSTTCLEHSCLLTSRCPQCHKPISIQEIVWQRCRNCLACLSSANTLSIEDKEIIKSCFIDSWPTVHCWRIVLLSIPECVNDLRQHFAEISEYWECLG